MLYLRLAALTLAAAWMMAAIPGAHAQAGGVGAGPTNSKSSITGQSGMKGTARVKSRRGKMRR